VEPEDEGVVVRQTCREAIVLKNGRLSPMKKGNVCLKYETEIITTEVEVESTKDVVIVVDVEGADTRILVKVVALPLVALVTAHH
jgi:hypothetical protein